jgi:ankyrin repeat protein
MRSTDALLINAGLNPNVPGHLGRTPLHILLSTLLFADVTPLLKLGADPTTQDDNGDATLHHLVNGTSESPQRPDLIINNIHIVVDAGLNPNMLNKRGQNVLFHIRNGEILMELLRMGVNPNIKDLSGQTPLQYAYDTEIARILKHK